jgi:NAD(P)H-flavin reductase
MTTGNTAPDTAAGPMLPALYTIRHRQQDTDDVFTIDLVPAADTRPFDFLPGQFNMLYQFGAGEVPISISGDPAQPEILIHTIRSVGIITRALGRLQPGATVGVRGPFGQGWPVAAAAGSDIVIVAGGLGLAPLRPAIYQVLAEREKYGNVCIYYGARTPEDILYADQLHQWRGRFDLSVDVIVDRAQTKSDWTGKVGVVTRLIGSQFDPLHTVALICGPEVMMRFAIKTLNQQGVTDEQIYVSMERNMKCGIGVCGHCQFGPGFVCRDGPVYRFADIRQYFAIREI